ncbi:signal recognition particle-docking protein FtsY [Mesorhizobium sp. BE184]|uniref:signal recognition particle-docking protein FtsY n=1 Tax=Mesorhizobium sp. BE184 TaxID=2817714 RepID=UPI002862E135|nr:signal recognition particle-docking protein FtsY [Mesorhizobium sp. BE184]MDR7033935.1 fused signal recognition particle receptor [Mesorhizobium sp. BE184]
MAGFFKKIFSFGKKEVVEERPAEDAPLPPINFDALQALKPAAEQAVPEFLKRDEQTPDVPSEPVEEPVQPPTEAPPAPAPQPEAAPPVGPVRETPVPAPQEALAEPATPEVKPSRPEVPEPPPEVPPPPAPEPAPERPAVPTSPQKVPALPIIPEQPVEIPPVLPEEKPPARPVEIPVESQPAPADIPPRPSLVASQPMLDEIAPEADAKTPSLRDEDQREAAEAAPPSAEIPPPWREPPPVEAQPVLSDIAPELAAEPSPTVARTLVEKPAPGKVTVAKKVEQKAEPLAAAPTSVPRPSWFQRMREGLARSSRELTGNIAGVFTKRKLDEETLQDLEDVLIRADLGVETALRVTDSLAVSRYGKDVSDAEVRAVMAAEVEKVLAPVALPLELDLSHKPHVILVVGVNGTGKTTTIGKLAAKLTDGGLSVMLAAGDTFRAAAIEQLKIWGERTNSPVIASKLGADAAGLAYDAFEKAKEAGSDVLIIDTAGRLQNKTELMAELEKIVRVLGKLDPEAPHTVLQTVDATTGQNALNQVEIFRNVAGVNGLVMTKLDGTARGGILVAIAAKHKLPVYFIGVGEQVDDLEPFSAGEFARAIAGVA